jgi:hypothetical protein
MKTLVEWLLELLGLGGVLAAVAYISWTKMTLGCAIALIGAFFPKTRSDGAKGSGELHTKGTRAVFKGSLRVGLVLAGIVLLIGSLADSEDRYYVASLQAANQALQRSREEDNLIIEFLRAKGLQIQSAYVPGARDPESQDLGGLSSSERKALLEQAKAFAQLKILAAMATNWPDLTKAGSVKEPGHLGLTRQKRQPDSK